MEKEHKPDLVQLTNSMFLGLAKEIKSRLKVPILCTLQGEDIFLEDLPQPYKTEAKKTLRERAGDVDGFVATSSSYADFMSDYLGVERKNIHVVPLGIKLQGHGELPRSRGQDMTIGYLARICPEKGLHLLIEAFDLLVQRMVGREIRLEVAGYLSPRDRSYFDELTDRISTSSWVDRFRYRGEVDRKEKMEFLSSIDILSVPTVYRDPKGLFVLEALANEVPVVQPNHGAFPELIEKTAGGKLVAPNSPAALAEGLQQLLEDKEQLKRLGRQGKAAVNQYFSDDILADRAVAVYQRYL
jgi:glycosyltransferase involved in cell wall biosynthesis